MKVAEDERYIKGYYDPDKRAVANAVQIHFTGGASTEKVEVEYPIGHHRHRKEGILLLKQKFARNLRTRSPARRAQEVEALFSNTERLEWTPVNEFMEMLVI